MITAPIRIENPLLKPVMRIATQQTATNQRQSAMPLATREEAAQSIASNVASTGGTRGIANDFGVIDTVELSDEARALMSGAYQKDADGSDENISLLTAEEISLMSGEAAGVQYDANRHAGMISTAGAVPTFVDVSNSYTEARIAAMPSSPTVEDVRGVIQRKMSRAADEVFYRADQQAGGVKQSTIAAQMGVAVPQVPFDVQTLQSAQSVSTVQTVPRTSGYAGYKSMTSRAVTSTAQSRLRSTV